jgi:uncharacterized protein
MIVDLRTVLDEPRHFDLSLGPGWWDDQVGDGQVVGFDGPLAIHVRISRVDSQFMLEGTMAGRIRVRCDRCLATFQKALESEFRLILAVGPASDTGEGDFELSAKDMLVDFVTQDRIDLHEIVKEQIYLSLPMKGLCREDCAGLCPSCGENLNSGQCRCDRSRGHPAFLKLNRLKGE